jgi:hypothetical protein
MNYDDASVRPAGMALAGVPSPESAADPEINLQAADPMLRGGVDNTVKIASALPLMGANIPSAVQPVKSGVALAETGKVDTSNSGILTGPLPVKDSSRLATVSASPNVTTRPVIGEEVLDGQMYRVITTPEGIKTYTEVKAESPTAMKDFLVRQQAKTAIPKLDRDMQKRVNELGISVEGKSADQVRAEVANTIAKSEQLTDAQILHANQVATQYKTEPSYKNWTTVTDGLNNALHASTLKTGLGDKTLIEEGQRILNPNSAVAVQTMKNFGASSGLLERIMPDYLTEHYTKGAILTDSQRKEYLGILQSAMENRSKEMEKTREEYVGRIKAARVPESAAKFYVRNPYDDAVKELADTKEKIGQQPKTANDVTEAAKWLKENPNDPRAAGVRKKLEGMGYKP